MAVNEENGCTLKKISGCHELRPNVKYLLYTCTFTCCIKSWFGHMLLFKMNI